MMFSIKDLFSKCDQNRSFLRIWSHLLKKSLTETSFLKQWTLFRLVELTNNTFILIHKIDGKISRNF